MLQLATGDFVRLVPKLPGWVPAPSTWAYLVGVTLVLIGLAILSGRGARTAATVLAAMIFIDVFFLYPTQFVNNPVVDRPFFRGFMWTNPLKCLSLIGGAAIVAGRFPDQPRFLPALGRGFGRFEAQGAFLLALFLVVCGLQHFAYAEFVATLVPSWVPGQRAWTHFTGLCLIAGGAGILVPKTAHLAAALSALMVFLWVLLLHIPRAVAGPAHANETAGAFEALALSGVALLVAGTRGPQPRPRGEA